MKTTLEQARKRLEHLRWLRDLVFRRRPGSHLGDCYRVMVDEQRRLIERLAGRRDASWEVS